MDRPALLRKASLFERLAEEDLRSLAAELSERSYRAGEMIFHYRRAGALPSGRARRRASPLLALAVLTALSSACDRNAHSAVSLPAPAAASDRSGADGAGSTGTLRIYLVDTEGGQATVFALPNGQILIADVGSAGARDGERILSVVRDELGASTVDYLLITHYHGDHVGGVPYLASRARVVQYFDHGDRAFGEQPGPAEYLALANAGNRRIVVPGDVLSLGGVDLYIVSAGGALIDRPLSAGAAANPFCAGAQTALPGDPLDENVNSVGFVLRFGAFDFLDLGDLLWFEEHALACPTAKLGQIDLYLTTHHGTLRSGAPQLVRALEPLAAIMNNGPRKGGGSTTWETLALAPGGADVWQVHRALGAPDDHNAPPEQIANLEEGQGDQARYLKVTVEGSGKFTINNPRTNSTRTYGPR